MQFDVFHNPILRARRAMPFVALLQADAVETGQERVVAGAAEKSGNLSPYRRLTPGVIIQDKEYLLLVQSMTNLPASLLRNPIGSIATHRDEIVAALDWLFLGI